MQTTPNKPSQSTNRHPTSWHWWSTSSLICAHPYCLGDNCQMKSFGLKKGCAAQHHQRLCFALFQWVTIIKVGLSQLHVQLRFDRTNRPILCQGKPAKDPVGEPDGLHQSNTITELKWCLTHDANTYPKPRHPNGGFQLLAFSIS